MKKKEDGGLFVPNIFVKVDFGDGCETSDLQIWIIAISPFLVKVIQTPLFLPFFDTPSILDYIKKELVFFRKDCTENEIQ